ncbi:MAG: hypothetical protein A3F83_15230 [Candidatus Glassbacteria bacterium RIFCSPLOWO2_12_FULL_58_11]|uniref:NADP-dependent oxidoreductase domain-containing protein n=1 Tax=Candidatus Glassbacteria bacterium RIFCSPLOWO2_12_FULL_58_11 TaxID=1817867 RepID=A0A1F5YPG9_9BACT|nr:MAG: hypothetical protein A3F83_15230 [Candidatus Glassbacteria bacterium RIFCSPLOWO2_12_FULL_58_11]
MLEPCGKNNVATIIRVPLDEGSLTGKFTEKTTFPKGDFRKHFFRGNNLLATVKKVAGLQKFREKKYPERSLAELALLFTLSHPDTSTVIVGMKSREQLRANLKVAGLDLLSPAQMKELKAFEWQREFWTEEVEA